MIKALINNDSDATSQVSYIRNRKSLGDANNDLMESGPNSTPTVFPAYLSGVGNELWRGQKLKWSPENSAFSLRFLSSFLSSLEPHLASSSFALR